MLGLFCFDQNRLFCFDPHQLLGLQAKEKGRNLLLSLYCGQPPSFALPSRSVAGWGRLFAALSLVHLPVFSGFLVLSRGFLQIPDAGKEVKSAIEYEMRC